MYKTGRDNGGKMLMFFFNINEKKNDRVVIIPKYIVD